jgi:hypothetical protein
MEGGYCSISEAVKLINQPLDGDKRKLKEFIDNVSTAFELIRPDQRQLLLKFVKTKITGEARSKLLVRDLTSTWGDVSRILGENYDIKRTLDYYACRMFSSRQDPNENIASWSSRIDTMQSELREAAYRMCSEEEMVGAMGLINHLAKACFVQGLSNEMVQTIVMAKGETAMLSVCIDTAFEEESAILSAKERGFNAGNTFKGPGRGSGFIPRDMNRGVGHPGRRVGYDDNRNISKSAHVVSDAARERAPAGNFEKIRCHACGALGHISRFCRKKGNGAWKKVASTGNGERGQRSSPTGNLPGRY